MTDSDAFGMQVVGMVQLHPLPGSARYTDEPFERVMQAALTDGQALSDAGFTGVQVQNMGDNPSTRHSGLETVAYMTRVCNELHRTFPQLSLSVLVNWDAEASLAVADAVAADFVRVEHTWVGASVTSWGISTASCHEATRFRSMIRSSTPIYADLLEPHAVPLIERPVEWWARAAVHEGAADGLFVTMSSLDDSLDSVRRVREAVSGVPVWLGGGATKDNIGQVVGLVDGVTVATSIKGGDMTNPVDPVEAIAFINALKVARTGLAKDPQ